MWLDMVTRQMGPQGWSGTLTVLEAPGLWWPLGLTQTGDSANMVTKALAHSWKRDFQRVLRRQK